VPILIEVSVLVEMGVVTVFVGMEEVTGLVVALAEASETQVIAISDTRSDTMVILEIIDLICYILLKYVI
jgi:hypothetical protein